MKRAWYSNVTGVALAVLIALSLTAGAQEQDQQAPTRRGRQPQGNAAGRIGQNRWFATQLIDQIQAGERLSPAMEAVFDRFVTNNLLVTSDLNAIESAHYTVAELMLRREESPQALQRLEKVLELNQGIENDAVSLTHLNIANLCRHNLGDMERAINEYKSAKSGVWMALAQRELLRTYVEMGRKDDALTWLQQSYDAAQNKGEKLAVLQLAADFYQRIDDEAAMTDTYERIASEFTMKDIEQMKADASAYVTQRIVQAAELRKDQKYDEASTIIAEIEHTIITYRALGRIDEARAMEATLRQAQANVVGYQERSRAGAIAQPMFGMPGIP